MKLEGTLTGNVRRIVAVRLDNLGDVLVTTPAIHAIRESLPDSHITLLTSPVGAQAGYLNPDLDDVMVYQAPWMDPWHELPQDSEREQNVIRELAGRHLDAAVIFTSYGQSSLPAAYLCYLAGIPVRVAASTLGSGSLLTTRHKHPDVMMHEVERGLDLVSAMGLSSSSADLVLKVSEHEQLLARSLIQKARMESGRSGPAIVVHPGCTMPARTYPWELYAQLADLLVEKLDALIFLTGSDGETELVHRIQASMRQPSVSLAGTLAFERFCGIIQAADLTVTNNTGPMHIAAALKRPVVALFALTNPPEQWGPWRVLHRQLYHDVACRICYSRICPYNQECLRLVSPEMVVEAVQGLLEETACQLTSHPALRVDALASTETRANC